MKKKVLILAVFLVTSLIFWKARPQDEGQPSPIENLQADETKSRVADAPASAAETEAKVSNAAVPDLSPEALEAKKKYELAFEAVTVESDLEYLVAFEDIIVDQVEKGAEERPDQLSLSESEYWTDGVIPYGFIGKVDDELVTKAMEEIMAHSKWKFVRHTFQKDYVMIAGVDGEACQSQLGRRGGKQRIRLASRCKHGMIMHELMHTIGFVHEQSREDRDLYLRVNWDNIQPKRAHNFQKLPARISLPVAMDFDFQSIMLYPSEAFSKNGKATMESASGQTFTANREHLSPSDILRLNQLYDAKVVN